MQAFRSRTPFQNIFGIAAAIAFALGATPVHSIVTVDTLTRESDGGFGGFVPFTISTLNPFLDPHMQVTSLRMRNFGILLWGCFGETCSGYVPTSGSDSFIFEVTGSARLENSATNILGEGSASSVPLVEFRLTGNTEAYGNQRFQGINAPGGSRHVVTNSGTFRQFGGSVDLVAQNFVDDGTYVMHDDAVFRVNRAGATAPPGSPRPEFTFLNRGTLRAETSPFGRAARSFVGRIDNQGIVQVATPAQRLELGGGRHGSALFETLASPGTAGTIEYSGDHLIEGTTRFQGANHVLLGKIDGGPLVGSVFTGRGPGPGRMSVVGGGDARLDRASMIIGGDGNSGEGALLALTGNPFSLVPGGTFTIGNRSALTVQRGGHVAVGTSAAPVGRFVVDGNLFLDLPSSILDNGSYEGSGLANHGTTTVGGRVEGPGTFRSYGRVEVASSGVVDVGTLRILDGTLNLDGVIRIGGPSTVGEPTGQIGTGSFDPTPASLSGSGRIDVGTNGYLSLLGARIDAPATPMPGSGPLQLNVKDGGILRVGRDVDVAAGAARFHVETGGRAVISEWLTLQGTGARDNVLLNEGTLIVEGDRAVGVLIAGGKILNLGGTFTITDNAQVFASAGIDSTGRLEVNGFLDTSGPFGLLPVNIDGTGTLCGHGFINGRVNIGKIFGTSGGQVSPGCSTGALTIGGDFTLERGAELLLEIERAADGSLAFDRLLVSGQTFLNGLVRFRLGEGVDGVRDLDAIRDLPFLDCPFGACSFGPSF